ncbi:MAG: helix-turn-helix domain containing protein [Zoogloeaceae bacterium]|nr:helix-turn-helix domain containing protein [Zoogloeaceae bacterium]
MKKALGEESQNSLARRTGLSSGLITNYVLGRYFPGTAHLRLLSSALGVSIDWLATGRGEMRPSPETVEDSGFFEYLTSESVSQSGKSSRKPRETAPQEALTQEEKNLLARFRAASQEIRAAALRMLSPPETRA